MLKRTTDVGFFQDESNKLVAAQKQITELEEELRKRTEVFAST